MPQISITAHTLCCQLTRNLFALHVNKNSRLIYRFTKIRILVTGSLFNNRPHLFLNLNCYFLNKKRQNNIHQVCVFITILNVYFDTHDSKMKWNSKKYYEINTFFANIIVILELFPIIMLDKIPLQTNCILFVIFQRATNKKNFKQTI